MTINEGLSWAKSLRERHTELIQLRGENSTRTRRFIGANADKDTVTEPIYDVKKLDTLIARCAREIRLLDLAIKRTNAATSLAGYNHTGDIEQLGTVENAALPEPSSAKRPARGFRARK